MSNGYALNERLTPGQVEDIRHLFAHGTTQQTLAQEFQVSQGAISKIVHGRAYGPVDQPLRYCVDCNEVLSTSKRRCEVCSQKWVASYYARQAKAKPPRRYRARPEQDDWYIVDSRANEKHGPYTYNQARYLVSKWNRLEVAS